MRMSRGRVNERSVSTKKPCEHLTAVKGERAEIALCMYYRF